MKIHTTSAPIEIVKEGVLIRGTLYNIDESIILNAKLLVDTGATKSSIRYKLATSLGCNLEEPLRSEKINTAGGKIELPVIELSKVIIGTKRVKRFEMLCNEHFDNQEMPIDGILGLDFLINYDIHIDFSNKQIHITERIDEQIEQDYKKIRSSNDIIDRLAIE